MLKIYKYIKLTFTVFFYIKFKINKMGNSSYVEDNVGNPFFASNSQDSEAAQILS